MQDASAELKALADSRSILVSLERVDGRKVRFTFLRHDQPYVITMYGTWDDDVEQWKKDLLQ